MVDAGHNPQPSADAALVVIGGLPATGKSTIARVLAQHHKIPYVRIDTIEQSLIRSGIADVSGTAGYITGYALAAEQLRLGLSVVVECVNPVEATRNAWSATAQHNSARLLSVEVICSDPDEQSQTRRTASRRHPGSCTTYVAGNPGSRLRAVDHGTARARHRNHELRERSTTNNCQNVHRMRAAHRVRTKNALFGSSR